MSTELFTPRSYPVTPRDFGSTYSCSSSEASSRLAARLERSEYKRSRGKQRLRNNYNLPRNHSRRKENRGSKRKSNSQASSATRETRTKSEEDGVTSVWEVYRQNPHQFDEDRTAHPIDTREKPKSWYGIPNESQNSQTRPRSVHDTPSSDRDFTPHLSMLPRRQEPRNSNSYEFFKSPLHSEDFKHTRTGTENNINDDANLYQGEAMNSGSTQYHIAEQNRNLDKNGMYLSRSLSSSFSSNVGSSDEREDSQGIYSAYDMAGRSPYDSMVNRCYSQSSSLSSSNASWHHSSSSFNYNVCDIPPLLDPIDKTQESSTFERSVEQNEHNTYLGGEFRLVKENTGKIPPPVAPKPSKYSSSYTIQLHSSSTSTRNKSNFYDITEKKESSFVQSHPQLLNSLATPKGIEGNKVNSKIVSVREIAKKFTPTSVRHISSEVHSKTPSGEDTLRVKAEHWPKVVSITQQETSPSNNIEDILPAKPLDDTVYSRTGVVMRIKDETRKNPEELASYRLSLQELIRLHEEQIAIQAKSAKTVSAHIYVKHCPSDASAGQSRAQEYYNYFEQQELKTELYQELPPVNKQESQNQLKNDNLKPEIRHSGYELEVRGVKVDQNSLFKVIELTGKSFENLSSEGTKERTARMKRHRTIGIVGYRQQIDRTSGEKAPAKQKRHTTVGIINDFKDIRDTKAESSPSVIIKDDKSTPSDDYEIRKEADRQQGKRTKLEEQKNCVPVKVFDIEKSIVPHNQVNMESSTGYEEPLQGNLPEANPEEPLVMSSSANYWYSSYSPKDLSPVEKYVPAICVSPDNYKEVARCTVKEPQQNSSLMPRTTEENSRTPQSRASRNLHSPVVELLPNQKGNPTAYYKAAVQIISHSVPSDHRSSKERASSASHSEQRLPGFDNLITHQSKPYSIPVAQVSPVNQNEPEIVQAKAVQLASPPPEPPSAHEMYETRLAMWNLLPQQDRATAELTDQSNEGQVSFGDKSKQSFSSKEHPRSPLYHDTVKQDYQDFAVTKENRLSASYHSQIQREEYNARIIEKLKEENQRLKEKNETEKREFRRMYEEQKKVANAYQKLEDRYRRRVHELQDALANCNCQGSIMMHVNERNTIQPTKSDKESQSSKTHSINSGMRIFEELEEWLTEQSKSAKASKVNTTSRDSLISSSSDLTGWDDHVDGAIDQVNGTHV